MKDSSGLAFAYENAFAGFTRAKKDAGTGALRRHGRGDFGVQYSGFAKQWTRAADDHASERAGVSVGTLYQYYPGLRPRASGRSLGDDEDVSIMAFPAHDSPVDEARMEAVRKLEAYFARIVGRKAEGYDEKAEAAQGRRTDPRRAFLFGQFSRQGKAEYSALQDPLPNQTTCTAEISAVQNSHQRYQEHPFMSLSFDNNSSSTPVCDDSFVVANFTGLRSRNLVGGRLCQERQQSTITRQQSITSMRPGTTRKRLNTMKQENPRSRHITRI